MNKLFKTLAAFALGIALATGAGVGVSAGSKAIEVKAEHVVTPSNGDFYIGATISSTDYYLSCSDTTSGSGTAVTDKQSAQIFTFSGSGNSWTIKFKSTNKYLAISSSKSNGNVIVQNDAFIWTSGSSNSLLTLKHKTASFYLQRNSDKNITKFGSYNGGQTHIWLESAASVPVPLTDIGLPSTASVQVGSTTTLTPIKTPTNANENDTLSWESLDPTYASVNQSGVVSGLKEGTATIRVNATDIGKSAICTVTINPIAPVPVTHTIAQCYTVGTGTSVKFNGVYMGAYGNNPYQGIFFADGESGIMIYQVSSVPSSWEVGKTVVAVSGKTAFYNGLVQITGASFELTSATVATPVVYTFLGNETTNTILSRKSSISGTVTAVTGQTGGAFVTGTDGKVTIDLGNGSTALIFIKKGVFSPEELNTFTEAYKVGNYVVSTGFVGYYKSGQSKDSAYDPASWQIVVPSVVSVGKYGAVEFARDFLADTDAICSSGSNDNLTALQAMWADTAAKYTALTSEERQKLADSSAIDTDIVGAIARYKYICGKYNTDDVINLQEYIEGVIVIYHAPNVFFDVNSTDNNTMMLVVISVAVTSITSIAVLLILKRRKSY